MKENEYQLLLLKRLSGEISNQESAQLDHWLSQSPDNERIANEYALIWKQTGTYTKQFSPNLDIDFAKVQARMQPVAPPVLKVLSFQQKLMRIAASLVFLALSIWAYSTFRGVASFDSMAEAQVLEQKSLQLPDGTLVWLRKGSSLQYFNSFEGKKERLVKLSGEAYFEVAPDALHPFRVAMDHGASVEVLGTAFNVQQSDDAATVLVKHGKVRFSPDGKTNSPVLTASQKAVFDRKAGTLRVFNAPTLNELAWHSGRLEFVNTPLSQVIIDLEKYYQVSISLQDAALANCPYSALLSGQSIKQVLDGLALTYQLKVSTTNNTRFVLSGGQCR